MHRGISAVHWGMFSALGDIIIFVWGMSSKHWGCSTAILISPNALILSPNTLTLSIVLMIPPTQIMKCTDDIPQYPEHSPMYCTTPNTLHTHYTGYLPLENGPWCQYLTRSESCLTVTAPKPITSSLPRPFLSRHVAVVWKHQTSTKPWTSFSVNYG